MPERAMTLKCAECGAEFDVHNPTVATLISPTAEDPQFGITGTLPLMTRVVALLRAGTQCLEHITAEPTTEAEAQLSSMRLTATFTRLAMLREGDPALWALTQTVIETLSADVTKHGIATIFEDMSKLVHEREKSRQNPEDPTR